MAYTLPNTGIMRPWNYSKNRYIHRRVTLTVGGAGQGGGSTGTASDSVSIPCPGRLIAVAYGQPNATDSLGTLGSSLTNGALSIKAETTAGVEIFADSDISGEVTSPKPVGTTAIDETAAATAATDGFSGGLPVRSGVYIALTGATDTEVVQIDMWFRLCTYVKGELVAQSGADGAGAVTRTIPLGNAGVLSAIALDYQNQPTTTDIVVKADTVNGATLFVNHATGSNTDQAPTLIGRPGMDETNSGATAATDGTESANAFKTGLYIGVAEANAFTSSDEKIVFELWIDD